MTYVLATSPGGRWLAARRGREVTLFGHDRRKQFEVDSEDCDLHFTSGDVLVEISRVDARTRVILHDVPSFDQVARLDIDLPVSLHGVTGSRLALVAPDMQHVAVLRVAQRAMGQQGLDVGMPFEFVVGLERDQLLFALPKEFKVWDAVSGRPLLKLALQLPPAPRIVGTAAGHLWAIRKNGEDVFVYRLSDGRPFHHRIGTKIEEVISNPASPVLVLATARGLVRLHCLAHTVTAIDRAPWTPAAAGGEHVPLAQLVNGDDIRLLGLPDSATQPWAVQVGGTQAGRGATPEMFGEPGPAAAGAPRAAAPAQPVEVDEPTSRGPAATVAPVAAAPVPSPADAEAPGPGWREPLAAHGEHVAAGDSPSDPPPAPEGSELAHLVTRLALGADARRALTVLYGTYLCGQPAITVARLARALGDWREALGQGELTALAMLRRKDGRVALRTAVTDLLDGAAPRAIRLAGGAATTPRAGAFRVSRDGRGDAEIETELVSRLGRIALVHGSLSRGLLEARLHGATAVTLVVPAERPARWPRDAGLVLVLYGNASAWVADVPAL